MKPRGSCSIVSYQKKRFEEMKPGVYLRGPKEDAHCRPSVSAEKIYPEALQHVLISKFETITDARRHIEALKGAEGVIESVSDLAQLGTIKRKIEAFTPLRKRLKTADLWTKLDQVLLTVAAEMGLGAGDDEPVKEQPMSNYLKELTTVVEGNRQDLGGVVEDVHELNSKIGLPPSAGPISLWSGHLEVKSDIGDLTESLKGKPNGSVVGHINQVENQVLAAEQQLTSLEAECDLAFRMVRDELSQVTSVNPVALGNANPAVINPTLLPDVERKVSVLEKRFVCSCAIDILFQYSTSKLCQVFYPTRSVNFFRSRCSLRRKTMFPSN